MGSLKLNIGTPQAPQWVSLVGTHSQLVDSPAHRPLAPVPGQIITELDTGYSYVWTGATWRNLVGFEEILPSSSFGFSANWEISGTASQTQAQRWGKVVEIRLIAQSTAALTVNASGGMPNSGIVAGLPTWCRPAKTIYSAAGWNGKGATCALTLGGNIQVVAGDGYGTAYTQPIGAILNVEFCFLLP